MGANATFPTNPAHKLALPQVDDLDGADAHELIRARKPFRCKIRDWRLLEWNMDYLKRKVGHVEREFIRLADKSRFTVTTAEYLGWLEEDPGWKSKYMPVGFVGPALALHDPAYAALLEDIKVPRFVTKSWGAGIMVRNSRANAAGEYYDTPCHYEDNVRPAIYVQVLGKKTLYLYGPEQGAFLGVESFLHEPPYISNVAEACSHPDKYPEIANATCYEIELEHGDLVHWPEFWFHWFIHHHDFQMNLRLDWDAEAFELNSMSASWAFTNALAHALGGFDGLQQKIAALPPEVRALLHRIDTNLLERPDILHGRKMTLERFSAGGQPVDQTAYKPPK